MEKKVFVAAVLAALVAAAVTAAIVLIARPTCEPDSSPATPSPAPMETDPYRPSYHYTPRSHWVNDPNGLVYYEGEYHLFYQYDRLYSVPNDISWGHAVSKDLINWQELPVAIPSNDREKIFSGSVVVDDGCTSGLCGDKGAVLVATYTSYNKTPPHIQSQHIASSTDNGRTWTKYSGNPVLDRNMQEFRDPKVIRHGDHWIMLVQRANETHLEFWRSDDLIHWGDEPIGQFPADNDAKAGNTDGVWECPDMFDLPVDGDENDMRTVLIVNINPGSPYNGSAGQYFIGSFDGTKFVNGNPDTEVMWLDYGMDYYATITWGNTPSNETIAIGWVSDWLYGQMTPTAPWKNSFSIPRVMGLKTIGGEVRLTQMPVAAANSLRQRKILSKRNIQLAFTDSPVPAARGRAVDIEARFNNTDARQFGVNVYTGRDQYTVIGYDVDAQQLFVDRTMSGKTDFSAHFPGRHVAPLQLRDGQLQLRILVDHNTVEVFAGEGEVAITDLIYPDPGQDAISFFAYNGTAVVEEVNIWSMKPFQRL